MYDHLVTLLFSIWSYNGRPACLTFLGDGRVDLNSGLIMAGSQLRLENKLQLN